jgi:CRISPR-associated endonuclease/helicase Cas3
LTGNWHLLRAHTDSKEGRRDYLGQHLAGVASLAGEFASVFGQERVANLLGQLHDVGKALPPFQDYLDQIEAGSKETTGPPHAIWGAALAYWVIYKAQGDPDSWKEICLPIAGHHGGLAASGALSLRLEEFLKSQQAELKALAVALRDASVLPRLERESLGHRATGREFLIRMLLSALADADFLATEEHFEPRKADARGAWQTLDALWTCFLANQNRVLAKAAKDPTPVNEIRAEVYHCCLDAAASEPGFFRLTVPTGGGKTRSSLAFGLVHALNHGLRRVVFAVPYTSITDQTAREYRSIFGDDAVLEHHSQMEQPEADESQSRNAVRHRLSTENWDAPIIVTTTVQLFESMFARRPGKIRKLHNLAKSVFVLDEVQTLPVELLETTLDGLRTLVAEYGCTVVLCTATQPAYERTPVLSRLGNVEPREIVPQYPRHFKDLESRVVYILRSAPLSWSDLATEIRGEGQVLVVLNARRDAITLLDALGDAADVVHLSTLLCGAHRRHVLSDIESRLRGGRVRAICTQVVEAGVDLDFPLVYRAMGPLDRIVQVAGRCNRHGTRPEQGRVIVFDPREGSMPRGTYQAGTRVAERLLARDGPAGLCDPKLYTEYFELVFSNADLDARNIQEFRRALDYPETADRFRFIPPTVSAVVPYGEAEAKLREWEIAPSRRAWRGLQPYVVNLFLWQVHGFERDGFLELLDTGLYRWLGRYDLIRGIVPDAVDPSDLII